VLAVYNRKWRSAGGTVLRGRRDSCERLLHRRVAFACMFKRYLLASSPPVPDARGIYAASRFPRRLSLLFFDTHNKLATP
jgi:hypothetical protein